MMNNQRFLQTPFWAEFKGAHGWKPYYFTIDSTGIIKQITLEQAEHALSLPSVSTTNQRQEHKLLNSSSSEFSISSQIQNNLTNGSHTFAENSMKLPSVSAENNQNNTVSGQINANESPKSENTTSKTILHNEDDNFNRQNVFSQSVDNISTDSLANTILSVLVRSFSFAWKKFSIAYVPMAPETNTAFLLSSLQNISTQLKKFIPSDTLCVRFDPPVDFLTVEERDAFVSSIPNFTKQNSLHVKLSPTAVQPPDTVILPLSLTNDELLANMKSKWRYNIQLAEKKGVTISAYHYGDPDFEKAFDCFYSLFETTGKRDGISPHAKSYYHDLLERSSRSSDNSKPVVTLYIASHEGDNLAGIITLFCNREAVYLYGASDNIKRNLMPTYLLQWRAIQDPKSFGCPVYDFYGMPPTDDPNHPLHGLYLFKTGFGGTIIHRPGSFDVPLTHFYKWYIRAEKARAWYHRSFLKKIRGR